MPYPFAQFKPWVDKNRRLIVQLQHESNLPAELQMVFEVSTGQTIINPLIEQNCMLRWPMKWEHTAAA